MEMVTLEVISGNYYFFPKTSTVVLKSTKFYDGRYRSLGVPQFSILLPCALPAVWGRGRETSQILYISSICELGEQLCQQDRAMSCTPSLLFVNISLRCSVLGGERERESKYFSSVWVRKWMFGGGLSVCSPHPHLTTCCLFSEFVKGKHCAVNLTNPFKEAERKQSGHSRVGKTENCCLVISIAKCCTWSYSVRLLGPELRQVGKVITLTL